MTYLIFLRMIIQGFLLFDCYFIRATISIFFFDLEFSSYSEPERLVMPVNRLHQFASLQGYPHTKVFAFDETNPLQSPTHKHAEAAKLGLAPKCQMQGSNARPLGLQAEMTAPTTALTHWGWESYLLVVS